MKSRPRFNYHPINLNSAEYPVSIVKANRNPITDQWEYLLSNGSLFCISWTEAANVKGDLGVYIIRRYMACQGYRWNGEMWAKSLADSSFSTYAKSRGLSWEPGEVIKFSNSHTLTLTPGDSVLQRGAVNQLEPSPESRQPQSKGMVTSMLRELRQYVADNRNLIFTVILIAIVDAFFLDGALKSRLKNILTSFIDKAEEKLGKDLNGDGKIGE